MKEFIMNKHGVISNPNEVNIFSMDKNNYLGLRINTAIIKGKWHGAFDLMLPTSGCACPVSETNSKPFDNERDCINYHLKKVSEILKNKV